MIDNIEWAMNEDEEQLQEEQSSRHLLFAVEDLLKRSHNNSIFIPKIKYQSKSLDDLLIYRRHQREEKTHFSTDNNDKNISNPTRIELDLSGIGCDDNEEDNLQIQQSRSAPASPTKIFDKELAAFIDCDQQYQQQAIADNFIYNIDLSDSNEKSHSINSKLDIFFEDDLTFEETNPEPIVNQNNHLTSLINTCLTITEENEEELEQLKREDDEQQQEIDQNLISIVESDNNNNEETDVVENENLSDMNIDKHEDSLQRLSTIYETPSPQPEIEEDKDESVSEKLIVYDIANLNSLPKSSIIRPIPESIIDRNHFSSSYTDASFEPIPNFTNTLTASRLCGTTTIVPSKVNSSTCLDDNFISSPVIHTPFIPSSLSPKHQSSSQSSPMLFIKDTTNKFPLSQHVKKMKVIQSSSSSLSDFISSTPISTLQNQQTPTAHHSLLNCSFSDENNEHKPSYNRRILTNGLLYSHCASNPIPRRIQQPLPSIKTKSNEKFLSNSPSPSSSSSSSEILSSSEEKLLTRSDFILQQEQTMSPTRKSSSLKSISITSPNALSKILYPIDFPSNHHDTAWYSKRSSHQHKVPTSDSGIVVDTRPTSKSSIEEEENPSASQLKDYEINYRKTLIDLTLIKKNLVDIESRLNEAVRELEIEQALIEGEHELVFKQILDASESDQQKIRYLYKNLQILIERIMTEKNLLRNEIEYTQRCLMEFEQELYELEQQYRSSDERILQQKEIIALTRKKYEDLEFQLLELETRCESELEQAEEHFQNEQKLVTHNAKLRQDALHELDHQQYIVLHQATMEKQRLEQEKQRLKLFFKQKKAEANELEQKIHGKSISTNVKATNHAIYQSTPINLYSATNYIEPISSPQIRKKDNHQENINEIKEMMAKVQLEKMSILEQQLRERYNENMKRIEFEQRLVDDIQNQDHQVKLREKSRTQERPLTRYLPIRSANFDLRSHIEGAGHVLDSPHLCLTSTSCRGYLYKMGGIKFKTWNRRWFVFDRQSRSLNYYQDKNETKLRGSISFQSIVEVYVDHIQSISLRIPEPREATFIVKTNQRSYYLVAPTVESMRIWIDVIITGAEGNTFAAI